MSHLFITFHPPFTTAHHMWVITVRHRYTGVTITITGYVIIVIAAVATDPKSRKPHGYRSEVGLA